MSPLESRDAAELDAAVALLFDKVCRIVDAWFATVLTEKESIVIETEFFVRLAHMLRQSKFRQFQIQYERPEKTDEWLDLLAE